MKKTWGYFSVPPLQITVFASINTIITHYPPSSTFELEKKYQQYFEFNSTLAQFSTKN